MKKRTQVALLGMFFIVSPSLFATVPALDGDKIFQLGAFWASQGKTQDILNYDIPAESFTVT